MLKNIFKLSILSLAAAFSISCMQDEAAPYLDTDQSLRSYTVNYEAVAHADSKVFTVRANRNWSLQPYEEYDWIKPFPASGEGDGQFRFIIDENNSLESREAIYYLYVDGKMHSTVFTVTQGARGEFIKADKKSHSVMFEETLMKLKVQRNVELELYTITDDSGANGSWVTLATEQPEAEDSLYIKVAESTLEMPRTAEVAIRMVNNPEVADTLTIFQAGTQELYGFPAEWRFLDRLSDTEYVAAWQTRNSVPADEGLGTYSYVIGDESNVTSKFTQVIGKTGDPYVTGAWPGDYWLYEIPAVIPANTLFGINFTARVSATGHKFWMLEYLDGEDWKPVGTVLNTEETGSTVEYTHALTATNSVVSGSFKVKNAATALKVRFRCMANWQSSGAGALTARNGGTSRMTGDEDARCRIEVLGTNVGELADVKMSSNYVALEGAEGSEGTFTFTSSESWVLTSDAKWLEFNPTSGPANEETTITVKAISANDTGALRKANIVLNAGMSTINVEVIQGSAGGQLEPFISIVGGNYLETNYQEKNLTLNVQANVEHSITTDVDWITITPASKALVEVSAYTYTLAANKGTEERTGHIYVRDVSNSLESILTIAQGVFVPLHVEWLLHKDVMAGYKSTFAIGKNNTAEAAPYIAANVTGNGKLSYVQIDKSAIDVNEKVEFCVGSTGHPYVNGGWPGDYWLFEATDGETYPAGTKVNIHYITRTSATGMKWWRVEYLDNDEWKPAFATQEGTTSSGEKVQYNVKMNSDGSTNVEVNCTVTYSSSVKDIKFRMLCLANDQAGDGKGPLEAPNGGNSRIAGSYGTSPVIKVVTE